MHYQWPLRKLATYKSQKVTETSVQQTLFCRLASRPRLRRYRTTSRWPSAAAMCRDVLPFWDTHTHTHTHTHTPIRMFRVKRRRRWLTSKPSFSRQCVGHICDTCSQLTWKSHSPHTHRGTFWPTLTPTHTLYLHKLCLNKPKSEVSKTNNFSTNPTDHKLLVSNPPDYIHVLQTVFQISHGKRFSVLGTFSLF